MLTTRTTLLLVLLAVLPLPLTACGKGGGGYYRLPARSAQPHESPRHR